MRLISRIRTERREYRTANHLIDRSVTPTFRTDGIPVSFDSRHAGPAVSGILSPHIVLPGGHRSRKDSIELSLIQYPQGGALVSALAKLAVPESAVFLRATASSHLSDRLARLTGPQQVSRRAASLIEASLFAAVITACVFQTIAHTACCFLLKR
jgi:hypothetical protein